MDFFKRSHAKQCYHAPTDLDNTEDHTSVNSLDQHFFSRSQFSLQTGHKSMIPTMNC